MPKEPSKQRYTKVELSNDKMTITRDFLAAIGFERESEGARPFKSRYVEIWNRSDFQMPVAFHTSGSTNKIWEDIEKVSITDFVNDLLDRQRAEVLLSMRR